MKNIKHLLLYKFNDPGIFIWEYYLANCRREHKIKFIGCLCFIEMMLAGAKWSFLN